MKRTALNLGSILIAFIIGLAINNACADSIENMSDSELRNLVLQLQKEVNTLKQKVSQLEGNSGSNNDIGYFIVDGVRFSPLGVPIYNKIKRYTLKSTTITNGQTTTSETIHDDTETKYDSEGRLILSISRGTDFDQETSYVYNGKIVSNTTKTTFKTTDFVSTYVYEYEYE